MRAWIADHVPPDNAAPAAPGAASGDSAHQLSRRKTASQILLNAERAALVKLERLIKEGRYIRREDAEAESAAKLLAIRHAFAQLPRALRTVLRAAASDLEAEEILAHAVRAIFQALIDPPSSSSVSRPAPASEIATTPHAHPATAPRHDDRAAQPDHRPALEQA